MAVAKDQIRQIITENNITSVADVYSLLKELQRYIAGASGEYYGAAELSIPGGFTPQFRKSETGVPM